MQAANEVIYDFLCLNRLPPIGAPPCFRQFRVDIG
jgi:hypothetical protein